MLAVTDDNFKTEIHEHEGVSLVDFYADWCGPCKAMEPSIEELSAEYLGKVKFAKLDVDNNRQQAMNFGVMSIPTLVFFKQGQEVDRVLGLVSKSVLAEKLNTLLA